METPTKYRIVYNIGTILTAESYTYVNDRPRTLLVDIKPNDFLELTTFIKPRPLRLNRYEILIYQTSLQLVQTNQ